MALENTFDTYHTDGHGLSTDSVIYLYWDEEKKEYISNEIKIEDPAAEMMQLVGQDIGYLNEMNIKEFNYPIFEEDLERLSDGEFEYFWREFFEEYLEAINENFISINIDKFKHEFHNTLEKKVLTKKIIHFIIMYLPYNVVSDMIKYSITYDIESRQDFEEYLDNLEIDDPNHLKEMLIASIKKSDYRLRNLVESLKNMIPHSKKGTLETSINLVQNQINEQSNYIKMFKQFIEETDNENLFRLVRVYADVDFENLM